VELYLCILYTLEQRGNFTFSYLFSKRHEFASYPENGLLKQIVLSDEGHSCPECDVKENVSRKGGE
jgi:hypothetical protein